MQASFARGISVAAFHVMRNGKYRVVQLLSVTVILAAEILLSFILIWLVEGGGVIACGKGIFDDPNWFVEVVVLVGVPFGAIAASVILFLWCSARCGSTLKLTDSIATGESWP